MTNNLYKLSICMIVKNEEKNLQRCLNSLKPFLDNNYAELIIVDTGSTDKSIEISKSYTDKIYYYEWKNDFSDARNFSISFAKGEWIFIFDADEEIEFEQAKLLMRFINEDETSFFNTITLKVKNFFHDNNKNQFTIFQQPLLFKNNGKFRYSGKVHNQPQFEFPMLNLPVEILHYGYIRNPELIEKKFERTSKLLIDVLKNDPDNIYYRFQLANTYTYYNKTKEAIFEIEKAYETINRLNLNKRDYIYLYTIAIHNYIIGKEYDLAEKYCMEAINLKPNNIDFYYYASCIYEQTGCYELLKKYAEKYLDLYENWNEISDSTDISYIYYSLDKKDVINLYLAKVYEFENNTEKVLKYLTDIDDKEILSMNIRGIIKYLIKYNNIEVFIKYFFDRIKSNNLDERLFNEIELLNLMLEEDELNILKKYTNELSKYDNNIFLSINKLFSYDEIHELNENNFDKGLVDSIIYYLSDKSLSEFLKFKILFYSLNYEYRFEEILRFFKNNEIITCISYLSLKEDVLISLVKLIIKKQFALLNYIKDTNISEKILVMLKSLILILCEMNIDLIDDKIIEIYICIGEYFYLNKIKNEDYELFRYLYFLKNNKSNESKDFVIEKLTNLYSNYNPNLISILVDKIIYTNDRHLGVIKIDEQINKDEGIINEINKINTIICEFSFEQFLIDYYLISKEYRKVYKEFIVNYLNNIKKLNKLEITKNVLITIIDSYNNLSEELYGQIILTLILNYSNENKFMNEMSKFINLFLANKISEAIIILRDTLLMDDKNQKIINYFYQNIVFKLITINLIKKDITSFSIKFLNYLNNKFNVKTISDNEENKLLDILKRERYIFIEGINENIIDYINNYYNNNNITLFISEFDFNYNILKKIDWMKIKNIVFTHEYLKNVFNSFFHEESKNIRIFVYQWDIENSKIEVNVKKEIYNLGLIFNSNMTNDFFDKNKLKFKIEFIKNMIKSLGVNYKITLYFYGNNKLYLNYLIELLTNSQTSENTIKIKNLINEKINLASDIDTILVLENNDGIGIGISKAINESLNIFTAKFPQFYIFNNYKLSFNTINDFINLLNEKINDKNKLLYDYFVNREFEEIVDIFIE